MLVEVTPGLKGKDASICFLFEKVLGPFGGPTSLKEYKGPEYLFLFTGELLWGQANVEGTGVEKGSTGTLVSVKVYVVT